MRRFIDFSHEGTPRLFVLAGVLLGLPYALFVGPLHVPDETGHFYRAYQTSQGFCKGTPGIGLALDIRQQDRVPWLDLPPGTTGKDMVSLIDSPQGGIYDVVAMFSAVNLYSCAGYVPSGAALWSGRIFGASPLVLMYLGRLANLGIYIILVYLALRLLPDWRAPMAVLALMPMALQQAASLSIDSVTIALSLLLSAYILMLAFDPDVPHLASRHHFFLALGLVLVALCKASVGLVLLTLLIPSAKFSRARSRWMAITTYIALAGGTMVIWQYANGSNGEIYTTLKGVVGIHVGDNLLLILHHPFDFFGAVVRTLIAIRWDLLQEFVGKLGWLDIRLPGWVIVGYSVVLVLAAAAGRRIPLSWSQRVLLIAVFALNILATFVIVGATWNVFAANVPIGREMIAGIQGRYLIPFAFPLLMAVAIGGIRVPPKGLAIACSVFVLAANLVALDVLWRTFQARTTTIPNRIRMAFHREWPGSPKNAAMLYHGRVVSRHGGLSKEEPMFLVDGGTKHVLEDRNWMVRNGYRWPDNVVFIAPSDLAAIPEGAPLRRAMRERSSQPGHRMSDGEIRQQETMVFGGNPGEVPVVGDWNGDGRSKKGIYRGGTWWLDWDGVGHHTTNDKVYYFGGLPGDIPVTGDWNGDGKTKIGVYRAGSWLLDLNGNGNFDGPGLGKDLLFSFGGVPGDIPVTGDWNSQGKTEVGVFRLGRLWILDANGNGAFDGTGPGKDLVFPFGGIAGDIPVVGDWNGDGKSSVGIFRHDHYWILDVNGNGNFDGVGPGQDRSFLFGKDPDDIPVVGDWNGNGKTKVGVLRKGHWILDVDGSGREDSLH